MPNQTTLEIYNRLVAGERIRVKLDTKLRYEVLRTELCRHHRITRDLLGQSEKAICSSYKDNVGTFHIGIPARAAKLTLAISLESADA